ncbi:hypothetical protein BDR07DRAFT_1480985 [Suillus spraguei]|nr:hypothetical protein BDR07DRAFT_1480985 [Suillus spraguei]
MRLKIFQDWQLESKIGKVLREVLPLVVTKDTLERPKAGSVAPPTDKAAKEADISGKINFYGMMEAFFQGSMPDNHQIDETLQYLLKTSSSDENKLSPDGRKLIQDACEIIETAHVIVGEKNADKLFQNFIWNTRDIPFDNLSREMSRVIQSLNIMDPSALHFDHNEGHKNTVRHLRTILSLILTNSKVRKLPSDLSVTGWKGTEPDAPSSKAQGKRRKIANTSYWTRSTSLGIHNDYKDAIRWLLGEVEQYASYGQTATGHGKERRNAITQDRALDAAWSQLRTLFDRFTNRSVDHFLTLPMFPSMMLVAVISLFSMNDVIDASDALIDGARCDDEFRNWLNMYIRKVLFKASFVLKNDCNLEGSKILESGRHFWDEKYKEHFDNLFVATSRWFAAMEEDPLNKRFGEDWTRLTHDLLFDSEGSLEFKADLWGVTPVPDKRHHKFTITLAQIQADMRNVAFYYCKKTGFRLSDSGIADAIIDGQGMAVTIHLVPADRDHSSIFKVKDVIRFFLVPIVKSHMEKVVAQAIRTGLEYLDGQLITIRDRMEETETKEGPTSQEVSQNDESASMKTSESKYRFKVVYNSRALVQVRHPAGWVNRTTERKKKAKEEKG